MPGITFGCLTQVLQQFIGTMNIPQTFTIVVVVIVDYSGIRPFPFGDMRQQAGTTEQVDENSLVTETLQNLPEFRCEHAFLTHERKRGLGVSLFHCYSLLSVLYNGCVHNSGAKFFLFTHENKKNSTLILRDAYTSF